MSAKGIALPSFVKHLIVSMQIILIRPLCLYKGQLILAPELIYLLEYFEVLKILAVYIILIPLSK